MKFKKVIRRVIFVLVLVIIVLKLNKFNVRVNNVIENKSEKIRNFLSKAYKPNPLKYLMYICTDPNCKELSCIKEPLKNWCGGIGDRFKGISSAFIWALLTNRTFLIRASNPCPLQESLDSNLIPWYKNINEITNQINNGKLSTFFIDLHGPSVISTLNILNYKTKVDVILIKSNFDISNMVAAYTIYHDRLRQLGIEPEKIKISGSFRFIYNMLFKLKPRLKQQYEIFMKKAKPHTQTKLICAQIRLGGNTTSFTDPIRMQADNTKTIWKFIKENFTSNLQDYKIYITTDHLEVQEEAKTVFGLNNVILTDGQITHIDRDKLKNQIKSLDDCKRYDKTYLDFHILQHCDMAVISRSGFGRLGVYLHGGPYDNFYTYRSVKGVFKFVQTS